MFSILMAFFDTPTTNDIKEVFQNHKQLQLTVANSLEEWDYLYNKQDFSCFMFNFDLDFDEVRKRIGLLREKTHHIYTPIIVFSSHIEYLVSTFVKWHSCEYFFLPMNLEKLESLNGLLHFYDDQHRKIHASENEFCQIHTTKGIYNIPHREILFAESTMKKSIIHMRSDDLHLSFPLYLVKERLIGTCFVQTHRSFIVNTNNISYIDKTKEPWGIFFFNSDKEAFVSRNHKKELPFFFITTDDEISTTSQNSFPSPLQPEKGSE